MTKLNRLAIAAGAASALGALAAAGKGVNAAMGGRPSGARLERAQRSPAYRPSAWHADGTLEAMEDPASGFRLAVQWHPEAGDDGRLFDALVAAAADRRASDARSPVVGIDEAG